MSKRVWSIRPQVYWYGWKTLSPISFGHDEYEHLTMVLGWTMTGRIVIAYRNCYWCNWEAEQGIV